MSNIQNFPVAKCYPTKSETAKFKFILHLAVECKIPVYDADGKVIGQDIETKYLRKGSSFLIKEDTVIGIEKDKYRITSHESEWTDEKTGELRTSTQHWLSPIVNL